MGMSHGIIAPTITAIKPASAIIGVVCFIISVFGSIIGKNAGKMLQKRAEMAGGIILILIGLKILAEHMLF